MSVRRTLAVIAATAIIAVFGLSAVASAQTSDYSLPSNTASTQSVDPGDPGAQVAGVSSNRVQALGASSTLPFTGADVAGTVAIAAMLIASGVVAVRFSRRRAALSA